jgi:hypothetical protein
MPAVSDPPPPPLLISGATVVAADGVWSPGWLAAAGVAFGLALTSKYTALVAVPVVAGLAMVAGWRRAAGVAPGGRVLAALGAAGLVERRKTGREARYSLTPEPMTDAATWMADVGARWDEQLAELRRHLGET